MAIIKIDGLITTSIAEASDILADGVSTTDFLPEGNSNLYYTNSRADDRVDLQTGANLDLSSKTTTDLDEGTNLYYTDSRVQSVIDNSEVHQIIDDGTNAPKMVTRTGEAAFDFESTDATYGATMRMEVFRNVGFNIMQGLGFKSTAGNSMFNLLADGQVDDGSHEMRFWLRGTHGSLQCRTSTPNDGGDLTNFIITGTELEFNVEEGAIRLTVTDEFGDTTTPLRVQQDKIIESSPHVFVNLTTTERDALTAEPGMMIFNTTDTKLQCYDGTAWNNLH